MTPEKYNGSARHIANCLAQQGKAKEATRRNRLLREESYYANPKLCELCGQPIPYGKEKEARFCGKSCSAKYNNSLRAPASLEKKAKISAANKGRRHTKGRVNACFYYRIQFRKCTVCSRDFYIRTWRVDGQTTCSKECRTKAIFAGRTYQNGSRKSFSYLCLATGTEVILESSWEVQIAELLDSRNIAWLRPEPLKWIDEKGKNRLYYPDFYLPSQKVYLDPKNKYCMKMDAYKMKCVSAQVSLVYGQISLVKDYVNSITPN